MRHSTMIKVQTSWMPNAQIVNGDIIVNDADEAYRATRLMFNKPMAPSDFAEALEEECPGAEVIPCSTDDDIATYMD